PRPSKSPLVFTPASAFRMNSRNWLAPAYWVTPRIVKRSNLATTSVSVTAAATGRGGAVLSTGGFVAPAQSARLYTPARCAARTPGAAATSSVQVVSSVFGGKHAVALHA